MHLDDDINKKRRSRSRLHKSRRNERVCDGDDLATVSHARRHWYDEAELDADDAGYEWLAPNSRAHLARRRVERYLDQIKLDHALEDALEDELDDHWSPRRRARKRGHAKRSSTTGTR